MQFKKRTYNKKIKLKFTGKILQYFSHNNITAIPTTTNRTLQPVPPGQSSIENDAQGIEKLLLKTQVS